jgi:hypothetical protein
MQTTHPGAPPASVAEMLRLKTSQALLLTQGVYYALTGLWAIVDLDSFQAVTGPKTDLWLVRTVAVLIVVIAASLLLAARKPEVSAETAVLAVGAPIGLTLIDVIHVSAGVISPVYLIDAVAEVALLAWWGWQVMPRRPDAIHVPPQEQDAFPPERNQP